jgi:hypothetical protein
VERAREVQQLEDGVVIRVPSSDAVVRTMTQATPRASYPRAPMVGWYNPAQLARTGISIITSTLFGRNADRRLLEVLRAARASPNGPHWESCDPAATPPRLIEPPIVIPAVASTVSRRTGTPATERS